jgi:hypothetical protein
MWRGRDWRMADGGAGPPWMRHGRGGFMRGIGCFFVAAIVLSAVAGALVVIKSVSGTTLTVVPK